MPLRDIPKFLLKVSCGELRDITQGRAILFTLKPEQSIREHNAPSSPFFAVVLKGQGVFTGGDGVEHACGPNTLLVFDAGEQHAIRAIDELVFVGFLHGAPGAQK